MLQLPPKDLTQFTLQEIAIEHAHIPGVKQSLHQLRRAKCRDTDFSWTGSIHDYFTTLALLEKPRTCHAPCDVKDLPITALAFSFKNILTTPPQRLKSTPAANVFIGPLAEALTSKVTFENAGNFKKYLGMPLQNANIPKWVTPENLPSLEMLSQALSM